MRLEAVRLRLDESRLRVVLSWATPPLLLLMAWGSWAAEAPLPVTAVLAALAALLGFVVAFDYPTAVEVDGNGIRRVCLLPDEFLAVADESVAFQKADNSDIPPMDMK